MPELPEVEILVRQLAPRLRGRSLTQVEVRDAKLKLPRNLAGRRILGVSRRGKNIIIALNDSRYLLVHLRMTGWFEFTPPARYRMALHIGDGAVYFDDSRRLGVVEVVSPEKLHRVFSKLGPDPLARGFVLKLFKTSRPVKVVLLDQSIVAGIGNIYASESLWRARINPRRAADRLSGAELKHLQRGIVTSLRKAVGYGPRIFEVQQFAVYERAGQPCRRCDARIRRIVQAQRSTYFCPQCQR